ncbi:DUF4367 domain-containing protein [Faecalicatena contorta]|nr:DUF4367 domain-containing protein [Faecalicatena contorta]
MLKNEYSKKKIERILQQDVEIPEKIENRIQDTYEQLGIGKKVAMKYTRKRRTWAAVAAVAVLAVGMSVVTLAASKFLSANLVENENSVKYDFQVDREKEAHKISVEATYIPEGYTLYGEDSPYGNKWHNEANGGALSVIPYNAADLDYLERTGAVDVMSYSKDSHLDTLEISGMKTDVFVNDSFYTDSEETVKRIYLFNEEYGYGIMVWSESDLPAEEIVKVAEGLKIEVLEETVPYMTDAELQDMEAYAKGCAKSYQTGVAADDIYAIGDEISDPNIMMEDGQQIDGTDDVRFTVQDAEILDALPLSEYPAENFASYDEVAPWMEEDGTLKPHERYRYTIDEDGTESQDGVLETVKSKYVVVKMKAKNYSDVQSESNQIMGISIAPDLTTLIPREDGSCAYPADSFRSANEGYGMQWLSNNGSSFPIYYDDIYYTEGIERMKSAFFRPMSAGEEIEYTLVYVADEDQLDNLYLRIFAGGTNADGSAITTPYVRISE